MSFPYPQDRHLDRKEKGEQPYKDAREAMAQQEASIQAGAEAYGEANPRETDEERLARVEDEAAERLQEVAAAHNTTAANDGHDTANRG